MDPRALSEEKLFDFRRRHSLPVIVNAQLQPRSCWTDRELEPPSPWRGLEPVLDRVFYQWLKGEGGMRAFNKSGSIVCSTFNRSPSRSDSISK